MFCVAERVWSICVCPKVPKPRQWDMKIMLQKCFSGKNTTVVGGRHTHIYRNTHPPTPTATPNAHTHPQIASHTDNRYRYEHTHPKDWKKKKSLSSAAVTQLDLRLYLSLLSLSVYICLSHSARVCARPLSLSLYLSFAHFLCVLACLVCVLTSGSPRIP